MNGWLLASYIVLWGAVIILVIILLVVLRQLGLIYVNMGSSGLIQLGEGPKEGSIVAAFDTWDEMTGESFRVPDTNSALTLLVFASSHCAICVEAVRGACEIADQYAVSVVVIGADEENEGSNDNLRAAVQPSIHFTISTKRHAEMFIRSTPQAIVLDRFGTVLEKAIVNHASHLRELLDHAQIKIDRGSMRRNIAS